MTDVPRHQVVLAVLLVAAVAFLGARALRPQTLPEPRGAERSGPRGGGAGIVAAPDQGALVVVHVAGAVRRAGVYRLRQGRRVADAVRRAGGATARADLAAINLAARVTDGQQVLVPARAAAGAHAATPAPSGVATGGAAPTAAALPLNLNTATLEQLDTLDGVGPATAQKILDERTRRGGFRSVEDLAAVPGIGPKRLAALRARVRV